MIKIKAHRISVSELDDLEGVLDSLFSENQKKGIATDPSLEEVSGRITGGRIFTYCNETGTVELRARLESNENNYLELDVDLTPSAYDHFLIQCQKNVPRVYAELTKTERDAYRRAL